MVCRNLGEKYELFLLGALSPGESAEIMEHLSRGCADCVGHLREATLTVYLLAQSARPAKPDPRMKTELLKRVRARRH